MDKRSASTIPHAQGGCAALIHPTWVLRGLWPAHCQVIQQVIRANAARERLPALLQLRDDLEAVLVFLRLTQEVKAFNIMHAPRFSALRWPIGSGFYPPTEQRSGRHCGLPAVPAALVSRRLVFQA